MPVNHQQVTADQVKDKIANRIAAAIKAIEMDVLEKRAQGLVVPRISIAHVLRIAGGIDKNTIKRHYHSETLRKMQQFLDRINLGGPVPDTLEAPISAQLRHCTQLLFAAREKIAEQAAQIAGLRSELAAAKVQTAPVPGQPRKADKNVVKLGQI